MICFSVGLEVRTSGSPFHAVGTDHGIADHGYAGSTLVRLEIIAYLQCIGEIIAQCSFRTKRPVVVRMLLLAVVQVACTYATE